MKKILPFIIILSLLVPFLPAFDFTLYALPYTPSESENSWIDDLEIKFQTFLGNNGIVANSDWFNTDYVGGFWNDLMDYMGFEQIQGKDYASTVYDYSVQNNQTADMIFNDSSQYILNEVNSQLPYYIYNFLNVDDFFTFYSFSNYPRGLGSLQSDFENLCSDSDYFYIWTHDKSNSVNNFLFNSLIYKIPTDFLDNYYLCLYNGNFSVFPSYPYQSLRSFVNSPLPSFDLSGELRFSNGQGFSSFVPLDFDIHRYHVTTDPDYTMGDKYGGIENWDIGSYDIRLFCGQVNRNDTWFSNSSFMGTTFLTTEDSFSCMVFKDSISLSQFLSGSSNFYKFDSSVDLGQYGEDIDYSKLYDLISSTVDGNSGNIIDSINNVANNYLQQQLDLLHDINNALNDGTGQSWLRRIYNILDFNFPLTLSAFDDLISAVQNISVSGGGDFSEATRVLHEIDEKLGILIDEPFTDLTDNDWDQMKSRVQTKFPFCIFSDIVAISVILNRPPQQPDLNFPIPIIGSESDNVVHIDLSPYEHARPYVHGALIFIFIIGLLALSVKIFDHLKS